MSYLSILNSYEKFPKLAEIYKQMEECPAILGEPPEKKKLAEMRVKLIRGWDKLLSLTFSSKAHSYPLADPLEQMRFKVKSPQLLGFESHFGYFSPYHPIAGIVTDQTHDMEVAQCLLDEVHRQFTDPMQIFFSSNEILAKVIAYRNLQEKSEIRIGKITYIVEEVIDLWKGMPAFALSSKEEGQEVPILLFRGTDLTLSQEKGWASILSGLDMSGPGFHTFQKARPKIEQWLQEKAKKGTPARLVGFSLGGVLSLLSLIEMPELINHKIPSMVFNPPGVSNELIKQWQELPEEKKPPHLIFLNKGDLVSQIGNFFSNGYEISLDVPMKAIEAHTTIMGLQPNSTFTQLAFSPTPIQKELILIKK